MLITNITSLREKIISLLEICLKSSIEILSFDETKLDASYTNVQFHIEGYQFPPFCGDRNNHGEGKMVFVRNGIIAKDLKGH